MAVRGLTLDSVVEYVSVSDPGHPNHAIKVDESGEWAPPQPTVFLLGMLPARLQAMLKDRSTRFQVDDSGKTVAVDFNAHHAALERVRFGLKGWKNFLDENGKEIGFETEDTVVNNHKYRAMKTESLNRLPIELVRELSIEIDRINSVPAELGKD